MSIAFRLGFPPLGIFGIPIKITGNAEDYKIQCPFNLIQLLFPVTNIGHPSSDNYQKKTFNP
jgi:hypothetical protein